MEGDGRVKALAVLLNNQDIPCRCSHGHRVLHLMNQMINDQLSDPKRVNSNTANSRICDLKNLKFKKLPQLKKKANKDHYRCVCAWLITYTRSKSGLRNEILVTNLLFLILFIMAFCSLIFGITVSLHYGYNLTCTCLILCSMFLSMVVPLWNTILDVQYHKDLL